MSTDMPKAKLPKEYVAVKVDFDKKGWMSPREIFWIDGSHYRVDRVLSVEHEANAVNGFINDTYSIQIGCHNTKIYFERNVDASKNYPGRWYVYRI